jgi:hypothetical protein
MFIIVAYLVGSGVMRLYEVSAEAIMQCFILNKSINCENGEYIDNCPEPLRPFFKQND